MVQHPAESGQAVLLISALSAQLAGITPAFSTMAAIHAV
jgi:hypothetical protein